MTQTTALWSRPFAVVDAPAAGTEVTFAANAQERAALARFFNLPEVSEAQARFVVSRRDRDGLKVRGEVRAKVTQSCVVTLELLAADIAENVDVEFAPQERLVQPAVDEEGTVQDGPEPLIGGRIDLGALATEFIALGLDPYPRKEGVVFDAEAHGAGRESPFAALAKLKPNE